MSILQMSIQGSMLIMAIVLVRAIALNKLPKVMFLMLWGVVLCRLLIPFSIPSPYSLATLLSRINTATPVTVQQPLGGGDYNVAPVTTVVQGIEHGITPIDPAAQLPIPMHSIDPVAAVWFVGMIFAFACFMGVHIKSSRKFRCALPTKNHPYISQWLAAHDNDRPISILYSDQILTPLTVGILRPRIILPKTVDMNDAKLMSYVLTHEYCHIKRFDMVWKMLMVAGVCVHWFNPLVWVMLILMNRDMELTCDEMVMRHLGATNKKDYAFSLINLAEQRNKFSPLYNSFSKNAIEERITAVMKIKKRSTISVCIACLLVLSITTVLATSEVLAPASTNDVPGTTLTATSGSSHQEMLEAVLSLKDDGYEDMSVSAFNAHIDEAMFRSENSDFIVESYEILPALSIVNPYPEFVRTTLDLTLTELAASINNETQYYMYRSFGQEDVSGVDIDGDPSYHSYLIVPCDIHYTIDDANTLTVGMRDQAFIEYCGLLQQVIDGIPVADYESLSLKDQLTESFEQITQRINDKYAGITFSLKIASVLHKGNSDYQSEQVEATSGDIGKIEIMAREEMDRAQNALPVYQPQSVMSMPDPTTGKTIYTLDNGDTWLSEEEYLMGLPEELNVEWWTYAEYEQWLEGERAIIQNMVGERGYNPSAGWYVWTQEMVDQALAQYEKTLIEIGNGLQVAKDWSVARYTDYDAIAAGTGTFEYSFVVTLKNGQIARIGSFETHEDMAEAVIAYCEEQVSAGNLTEEDFMGVLEELQNPRSKAPVPMTAVATSPYDGDPAEYSIDYSEYAPFGLQVRNGMMYYEETPVRIFEDRYTFEGNDYSRNGYFSKDGIIDVRAVRDPSIPAFNANGSTDPAGALVQLEIVDFSLRSSQPALPMEVVDTVALSAVGGYEDPSALVVTFAPYVEYGLTFDPATEHLIFQGQIVRQFTDEIAKEKGSIINLLSRTDPSGEGVIDVYAVRDYTKLDAEGNGTLLELAIR